MILVYTIDPFKDDVIASLRELDNKYIELCRNSEFGDGNTSNGLSNTDASILDLLLSKMNKIDAKLQFDLNSQLCNKLRITDSLELIAYKLVDYMNDFSGYNNAYEGLAGTQLKRDPSITHIRKTVELTHKPYDVILSKRNPEANTLLDAISRLEFIRDIATTNPDLDSTVRYVLDNNYSYATDQLKVINIPNLRLKLGVVTLSTMSLQSVIGINVLASKNSQFISNVIKLLNKNTDVDVIDLLETDIVRRYPLIDMADVRCSEC